MFVVELQIHSHHLLLALLAAPVLWVLRSCYRDWQISRSHQRHIRLCQEGRRIKGLESHNRAQRAKGLPEVPVPSGPRHRAYAANFTVDGSSWW